MPPQVYSGLEAIPASVDEVTVSGLNRTHDSLVRKQIFSLMESRNLRDVFENVKIAKERLAKLGVFKSVYAVVDVSGDNSKPNAYKITFKVVEKRFVTARMSMTHGTDGITKACGNVRLNNFARHAESADIDVEIGSNQMVSKFATISKPLENNPFVRVSIGGTEGNWDHYWAKFQRHERSVFTEVQAESFIGLHRFQWDAVWRETEVKDQTAPLGVLKECGSALKTGLRHVFESDARPDLVFPDSGYLCRISQEIASITPGSQTGQPNVNNVSSSDSGPLIDRSLQLKLEGLFQKPLRLCDWLVGEVTFSSGLVHSLTGHTVHISDRFFLGGPLELRGFQWRTVSPSEPLLLPTVQNVNSYETVISENNQQPMPISNSSPSSPIGADAFWLAGAHLYTPLPYWGAEDGSFSGQFRLHGFFLAGSTIERPIQKLIDSHSTYTTANELRRYLLSEFKGKPRTVLGMGIVFRFAGILRMELNYCLPLTCQPGDQVKPGFAFGFGMYYM
ncbi:Sorting and assembly machinery component 50 like [Schistosoma japonicum]|nr:Sorting and assembly machinery component 50 like [Schistosoma japonicum]KAH8856658.1 Sorting and assembly machinery component 50 like [Schistosoma japonicum]